MTKPFIYPVIHHLDKNTSLDQVMLCAHLNVDGVFLISHHGDDEAIVKVAIEAKKEYPNLKVGINLLSTSPVEAVNQAIFHQLDMVWADSMGVDSKGLRPLGQHLSQLTPKIPLFCSVAFKHQPYEPNPPLAAVNALNGGFIPTTSGEATGSAPDLDKIIDMSLAVNGKLAIASGMTPDNIHLYAPYLKYILVATGVSMNDYQIDPEKLKRFIQIIRT